MSTLRLIRPPWWMIALPLAPLVGFAIIAGITDVLLWSRYGELFGGGLTLEVLGPKARFPCALVFALMYGAFRGSVFQPAFRAEYRKWLAGTPWTSRLPLPLGPIHLVWQDLCFLVPATLLAWGPDLERLLVIPIVFGCAYEACITIALFGTGERWIGYAMLALAGLTVHVAVPVAIDGAPLWPTAAVVALSYPLAWLGLRRSLARFSSWDTRWLDEQMAGFATNNREEALRRQTAKSLGWPYDALPLQRKPRTLSGVEEVVVSVVFGWWLWASRISDEQALGMFQGFVFAVPFILAGFYWVICRPPISLWGRLRTGRLIIPRYDRCLLWPAAMCVVQYAWLRVAADQELPLRLACAVQMVLFMWCLFRATAAFESFRLTGAYRMPVPLGVTLGQQAFTNA